MKRVLASASILLAIAAFVFVATGATSPRSSTPTYKIEFDNAFGLVTGASFKVAGVPAGTIAAINLDQKSLNAVVTVKVSTPGLSSFHADATCDSEPQSLIGEYFVTCEPGTSGPLLRNGATIPVTHTRSTIPADLLLNIMRMPERERLPLIIDSLGAGVAGRAGDLQAALRRAVPALTETDNLLNLLARDSTTLQSLTHTSNQVFTALANNTAAVTRFIDSANNAARDTAVQHANLQATFHDFPGFLAQLRPAMARLGQATAANLPVLQNLNSASGMLDRFFTDLPAFSRASRPAFRALGKAGVTGKVALDAARPTIAQLNRFAQHAPELAQNLSIVLPEINTQKTATERNSRSPGGKGFSGLQALLQFAYNVAGATNTYGPVGHLLAVDGFLNSMCTPYATPGTVAANLKQYGSAYRSCYAFLGPNQPGVNETDPSNPHACVPDPGGVTPGHTGPTTSACKLAAADTTRTASRKAAARGGGAKPAKALTTSVQNGASGPVSGIKQTLSGLSQTVGQVLNLLGGGSGAAKPTLPGGLGGLANGVTSGSSGAGSGSSGSSQAQRLLNYLLSP
jgi:virulence factor Mce-like protein